MTGAVAAVNGEIAKAVVGRDARDQEAIDKALIALDGTENLARLGGNAVVATSMAVLHAAAAASGQPLWRHLSQGRKVRIPLPEIRIFGGGAHAARRVDVQDFMVMRPAADSFAEALDWTAEVYRAAGGLMKQAGKLQGVADEGGFWPAFGLQRRGTRCAGARDRERRLQAGCRGGDLARHRGVRIRPWRRLQARAG